MNTPNDTPDSSNLVRDLIDATEVREVRLVAVHAVVNSVPPEMTVEFGVGNVGFKQENNEILIHFEHKAQFSDGDGDTTATISLVHVVRFTSIEELDLNEDLVSNWVFGNVYFMVYPYVRQALQDTCLRLDLPPVVLGYLKRGEISPESVTLVVSQTRLVQQPDAEEPLPLDGAKQ